jgi:hypothetical protein
MTDWSRVSRISANSPGCYATYRQVPDSTVWRIDEWQLDDEPPRPQQFSLARMRKILKTAQCGAPRWRLTNLTAAVEEIRRQTMVATTIEAELSKRRAEKARERRAVVNAVATLHRYLLSKIDRWQRDDGERPEGASHGELVESYVVTEARALLGGLDRLPGIEPLAQLEEPWHGAAIELASIYRGAFGARHETPSWYRNGPGIGFVRAALKEIGCGDRDPDAIRQVIRRNGL